MTLREAAAQAGISDRRWRQIETGSRPEAGTTVAVHAPPATLARMSAVVRATPRQLRDAGRDDAAVVLEAGPPAPTSRRKKQSAGETASDHDPHQEIVAAVAVDHQRTTLRLITIAAREDDPVRAAELLDLADDMIAMSAQLGHLLARTQETQASVTFQATNAEIIANRNRVRRAHDQGSAELSEIAADEHQAMQLLLRNLTREKDRLQRRRDLN